MPKLNEKEYECDLCHGVFDFVENEKWNHNKAMREFEINFPAQKPSQIICDDCWQLIKPDA